MILEKSEKAKKLREQRKFGKKVCVCFVHLILLDFFYCTLFIRQKQQIQSRTMLSTLHHPGASVIIKNTLLTCRI